MKKFLVAFFVISMCLTVYAKTQDDKFIDALRNCSSYSDSGQVTTDGITAVSTKEISGWNGGRCVYREKINLNGANVNIRCNFSKAQINEITSVADAYFLTLKYSQQSIDTSSMDAIKNNPLANVFNKYIQDPSVCSVGGLQ